MSDRNAWVGPLVERLRELAKPEGPDRATLAHLRRGLCGPADYTLSRVGWLFRGVPDDREDHALDCAILVAGLYAWVKGNSEQADNMNFGQAFGHGLSDDDKKQREKRFTDLLDTDSEDLSHKLRQAVTLIKGTPLDWKSLIVHLMYWNDPDRWVQKQWARGFWWNPKAERTDEPAVTS